MDHDEREAHARKMMAEMKLKNEKLKERHKEVERDRQRAEARNSSITTGRSIKREVDKYIAPRAKHEREWDRGKLNPDSGDWDSPKHHDYYYTRNTRNYSAGRIKKDDSWRSRSANFSNKPTSSYFSSFRSNKNEALRESHKYRNDINYYNSRSRSQFHSSDHTKGYASNESSHRSFQNSRLDIDYTSKFSVAHSRDDYKREPRQHSKTNGIDELMWQCGSMNEVEHKLTRIENWVKSINMNHAFSGYADVISTKDDSKPHGKRKELSSHRERSKRYGLSEDSSTKKTKEIHSRTKDKSQKYGPTPNRRGRGIRIPAADKSFLVSDSKNQREGKRKNLNERSRRKCESDMSDRASSMKESDDVDCGKAKTIRARSNSQSSENSFRRKEKRVYPLEKPYVIPSGSQGNENWESNKFTSSLERDVERKRMKGMSNHSKNYRRNFSQINDNRKYDSKSLPSHDGSENYEYDSHNYQMEFCSGGFNDNDSMESFGKSLQKYIAARSEMPNYKKPKNHTKKKIHEDEEVEYCNIVLDDDDSNDGNLPDILNWKELSKCTKHKFQKNKAKSCNDVEVEYYEKDCQRFDKGTYQNLYGSFSKPIRSKSSSKLVATIPIESKDIANDDSVQCIEDVVDDSVQCIEDDNEQNIEGRKHYKLGLEFCSISSLKNSSNFLDRMTEDKHNNQQPLRDTSLPETSQNFQIWDSDCIVIEDVTYENEFDSIDSKGSKSEERMSKDFVPEYQTIETKVFESSFPQDANSSDDVYKKFVPSAENVIASQNESQSVNPKVKVKRYRHKGKYLKAEKFVSKPKRSVDDEKVSVKSVGNEIQSKKLTKDFEVVYLYTDSELSNDNSSLNVQSPDKNISKHVVQPILDEKQMLTDDVKDYDDDEIDVISGLNESDEWSTMTDEDNNKDDGN